MLRSTLARLARPTSRLFSSRPLYVDNPYTGEVYCPVRQMSDADANLAVGRSSKAFKSWKQTTLSARLDLVARWIQAVEANADVIAKDITCQMGKPLKQAKGEVSTTLDRARAMMSLAPTVLSDHYVPCPNGSNLVRKITREPVGPVLVLSPWNYPLLTAVNVVVPAIIAGNTVVIKHSDRTPLCSDHFVKTFQEAGAPDNLIQALYIDHPQVGRVIQNPNISYVAFTGSVEGGRQVYKAVANRFIDVGLELGGKDPSYVAADADVAAAADSLVDGAMYNAGQSCCSVERVYVHKSKYAQFLEKAVAISKQYVLGDPLAAATSMGPIAMPHHPDFLENQVKQAKSMGARVLLGGHKTHDANGRGRFFAPTVLADCTHSMSVMMEESFGPIMAVAPVESDEEAIQKMNDSAYGLTSSVYTAEQARAERIGKELQAGTVFMNRCDYLDPLLPWSGWKDSGKGVSLSALGFGPLTKTKGYNFRVPVKSE